MLTEEEQLSIEFIENAIGEELNSDHMPDLPDPPAAPERDESIEGKENKVSRKPFVIRDFEQQRDKEMAVFTHAKKLSEYIFVITEKSPKKLRWSIVARLQNCSVDVIENLYRANYERETEPRLNYQKSASVSLSLLDFFAEAAKRKQAINFRQLTIISRELTEVRRLLNGWVKSTKNK